MLELDNYTCKALASHHGHKVPLLIEKGDRFLAVGCYHGLLNDKAVEFHHPLEELDGATQTRVLLVNEYLLTRNLPGAYEEVIQVIRQ